MNGHLVCCLIQKSAWDCLDQRVTVGNGLTLSNLQNKPSGDHHLESYTAVLQCVMLVFRLYENLKYLRNICFILTMQTYFINLFEYLSSMLLSFPAFL